MTSITNTARRFFFDRHIRKMIRQLESGLLDAFLETLLKAMKLFFLLDCDYRKNIEGFRARYAFESKDGKIAASAIFANDRMKVNRKKIGDTNVTVTFKNGEALMKFLFNRNPDIIGAVLDNDVTYEGNLNYLAKFAYMAKNLQLRFAP